MARAAIILAAGRGTRMKSDRPKVLHEVAGLPMLGHVLNTVQRCDIGKVIVVTGYGADAVDAFVMEHCPQAELVHQSEQLGTGHAVAQAIPLLSGFRGEVVVLYGDVPFIQPKTVIDLFDARSEGEIALLGFEAVDPGKYGRLVLNPSDQKAVDAIVEFKDASDAQRLITLCNSGVMALESAALERLLRKLNNDNASGEYYLTDLVALHAQESGRTCLVRVQEAETLGVNTLHELADAEARWQRQRLTELVEAGVRIPAPDKVHLHHDTIIGPGSIVEPFVVFGSGVTVENNAVIRAFSHLEGCHVSEGAVIGPYARLRPGAEIGAEAKIGNFVEVKAAQIYQGAKVNHLTYIGDATVGERANIGAGSVTANYDGVAKHITQIGADAFVGSGSLLIAPVKVGAGAITGSGSVITEDVPDGALALGRARQVTKLGRGARLMEILRARKAKNKEQ